MSNLNSIDLDSAVLKFHELILHSFDIFVPKFQLNTNSVQNIIWSNKLLRNLIILNKLTKNINQLILILIMTPFLTSVKM